jgi:hypothetical protein
MAATDRLAEELVLSPVLFNPTIAYHISLPVSSWLEGSLRAQTERDEIMRKEGMATH